MKDRVLPLLRANIECGFPHWTTNNVEAMNHVLKSACEWRQHKLPELIGNIKAVKRVQYTDAEKALYGEGEYTLQSRLHARYSCQYDAWVQLDSKQRQQVLKDYCRLHSSSMLSVTTDGHLTVTHCATAGKKLHQRKHLRSERTTSLPKKRRTEKRQ
jgi:hypothetical protein